MSVCIERCKHSDIEQLVTFLDKHWKKDHVFVKDRRLLDWQHKTNHIYHYVLAKIEGEIVGVLGYIPTSHYSVALKANNDMWLAIWKVKDGLNKPGLGFSMLTYLMAEYGNPSVCSIGLSSQVIPIYKAMGYTLGTLSHRAFFNQFKDNFQVGRPGESYRIAIIKNDIKYKIQQDVPALPESFFNTKPAKDPEYIANRYMNHPRYKYLSLSIYQSDDIKCVAIYREIELFGSKLVRIVDLFGDNVMTEKYNSVISEFLRENDYEYIDIVSNLQCFPGTGFIDASSKVTIPNYFEPFLHSNVAIDYAYKSDHKYTVFRGDSDQDRPNT